MASESDDDSRTATIHASAKSSASNSPAGRKRSRRRAKRAAQRSSNLALPSGATFSQSAAYLDPSVSANVDQTSTANQDHEDSLDVTLGQNRLATGFGPRHTSTVNSTPVDVHHQPVDHEGAAETVTDDPIEISSDDSSVSDDDGGMIVNINGDGHTNSTRNVRPRNQRIPPPPPSEPVPLPPPPTEPAMADSASEKLKLEDLSPEDLELQIKYALFHLDRDQIDLNRPATCLTCLRPGHMSVDCPVNNCEHCHTAGHPSRRCHIVIRCSKCRQKGHRVDECPSDMRVTTVPCDVCDNLSHVEEDCPQRFFPKTEIKSTDGLPVRLWISCCKCASKSHLVGDCPDADDRPAVARWSLKSLQPGQFVNKNLEANLKGWETEAANRNMRPPGMQIRGRSDIRHALHSSEDSSDSDDRFIRPVNRNPPRRPPPNFQFGSREPPRFGDSNQNDTRGRSWYATDSFGQRRSRSPHNNGGDQWRPDYARQRSPRRFDSRPQNRPRSPPRPPQGVDTYRPDDRRYPQSYKDSAYGPPAPSGRPPTMTLPTRNGSNPNLNSLASRISTRDTPNLKQNNLGGSKKKKKSKQKS